MRSKETNSKVSKEKVEHFAFNGNRTLTQISRLSISSRDLTFWILLTTDPKGP